APLDQRVLRHADEPDRHDQDRDSVPPGHAIDLVFNRAGVGIDVDADGSCGFGHLSVAALRSSANCEGWVYAPAPTRQDRTLRDESCTPSMNNLNRTRNLGFFFDQSVRRLPD